MKKTIALILIVAIGCSLTGCFQQMTPVENFLLAIKKMDLAAMRAEMVPDETAGSAYRKLGNADLNEESLQALGELYSLVQYKMGEVSSDGDVKTVSVTLKVPDMERIRSLAMTQILVSGDTAATVIGGMLADGSVSQNMMKEYTLSVKMTETDGVFKIPYGDKENAAFAKALAIAEMIDFLS